jgi:ACS family tartrate transporter-like MFS transporter
MTTITKEGEQLLTRVSWRLIPFMLLLYIVSYLDRINVSFAALQMNEELGISHEAFGFGAGIFFFGYCIFGIPSNLVIERFGARRWIASIMIIWGLITVAICLVRDQSQFFILRFFLGVAEAGFFPGMIYYLTFWFPPKYYAIAVARFMVAIPLAGIIGSAVSARALSLHGAMGISGWMWLFVVTGVPAVLLGIVVLFLLPDRPHQASWLSESEAEMLTRMTGADRKGKSDKSDNADSALAVFLASLKQFVVWRQALLYFSLTVSMYGFQLWLPQIIKSFDHVDDSTTALLSAIPALFQALGMIIIAGNSDRIAERKFHVAAAAILTCFGLALAAFGAGSVLKMAGLCLAAFGIWGSVGPFWALTTDSVRVEHHSSAIAFINSVGNLGGFAGPYIVGAITQVSGGGDFAGALLALCFASVLACGLAVTSRT